MYLKLKESTSTLLGYSGNPLGLLGQTLRCVFVSHQPRSSAPSEFSVTNFNESIIFF